MKNLLPALLCTFLLLACTTDEPLTTPPPRPAATSSPATTPAPTAEVTAAPVGSADAPLPSPTPTSESTAGLPDRLDGSSDSPLPPATTSSVRSIVDLVRSGDTGAIAEFVEYEAASCRSSNESGYAPSCSALGLPDGSSFQAIPVGTCDIAPLTREQVPDYLLKTFGWGGGQIDYDGTFVPLSQVLGVDADALVVFLPVPLGIQPYRALAVCSGRIVAALVGCGDARPPPDIVDRWLEGPLVPTATAQEPGPLRSSSLQQALASEGVRFETSTAPAACPAIDVDGTRFVPASDGWQQAFTVWEYATRLALTGDWYIAGDGSGARSHDASCGAWAEAHWPTSC